MGVLSDDTWLYRAITKRAWFDKETQQIQPAAFGLRWKEDRQDYESGISTDLDENFCYQKVDDEGVGIAGMTPEQRTAAGKKGGKNSRTFLLNSIWINNGVVNKRVLKNLAIPPGFVRGRKKSKKAIERENRQKKKNPYNKGVPKPYLWLYKRPLPEVLHQMVWDRPMIAIAKEIGCSDNAIRKWCKFNDIPYPSRGFWNKIANNKLEGQTCPLFVNKIRSNL